MEQRLVHLGRVREETSIDYKLHQTIEVRRLPIVSGREVKLFFPKPSYAAFQVTDGIWQVCQLIGRDIKDEQVAIHSNVIA